MTHIKWLASAAIAAGSVMMSGCATLEEAAAEAFAETHHATLTGAQVVGGGDVDGAAMFDLSVSDELDQICYNMKNVRGLGTITGAHIHRGAMGVNGPVVFGLKQANEGGFKNCVNSSEWTEAAFENNPTNYYVQIHTTEYPNGAIRGQMRDD